MVTVRSCSPGLRCAPSGLHTPTHSESRTPLSADSELRLGRAKFFRMLLDNYPIPRYKASVLLAEGRQPVTSADGAGCGACCRAARHRRHREAKGHRPGPTRRALPSMAGRGRGERGESPALGEWETTPPRRRKHGPDSQKSPHWSAGRRSVLSPEDAPCVSQERAAVEAPFRRSTPSLVGEGAKGLKAHPAPFQIIRAAELWLFDK
jgi:hypothetical protein